MQDGRIEQVGTPQEIYNHPANRFVASFVGQPPMNFVEDVPLCYDGVWFVEILGQKYVLPDMVTGGLKANDAGRNVSVGIRPVNIEIGRGGLPAVVEYAEPLGSETVVHLNAHGQKLTAVLPEEQADPSLTRGQKVSIQLDPSRFYVFPEE